MDILLPIFYLSLAGAFGGIIRGFSLIRETIKKNNNREDNDIIKQSHFSLELTSAVISGCAGGIVIFILIPINNFEAFAHEVRETIEFLGLSIIGGYGGTFILDKAIDSKLVNRRVDQVQEEQQQLDRKINKVQEEQREQQNKDLKALHLVDIQLSNTLNKVEEEILERAVKSASPITQDEIFDRTRSVRKEADDQKRQLKREGKSEEQLSSLSKKIARTIPIFKALTESEYGKDKHRYFANLGYALKDQSSPDWKKALHALEQAISLSTYNSEEGGPSAHYYFNRAVCLINNEATRKNLEDIKYALEESSKFYPLRSSMLHRELAYELLEDWLDENKLKLDDGKDQIKIIEINGKSDYASSVSRLT